MEDTSNTKPVDIGDDTNDSDDETQETRGVESASTKPIFLNFAFMNR